MFQEQYEHVETNEKILTLRTKWKFYNTKKFNNWSKKKLTRWAWQQNREDRGEKKSMNLKVELYKTLKLNSREKIDKK